MIRAMILMMVVGSTALMGEFCLAQSDQPQGYQRAGSRARAQRALQGLGRSSFGPEKKEESEQGAHNPLTHNPHLPKPRTPFQSRTLKQKPTKSKPRFVEIEISGNLQGQVGATQEWIELLNLVGANRVRAKSSRDEARSAIDEVESADSTTIIVQGALTPARTLLMAGETYTLRDRAAISEFVRELKDDGLDTTLADKLAFGLTAKQLVGVHTQFSSIVDVKTKGTSTGAVVAKLIQDTKLEFVISSGARRALGSSETVAEELSGLSAGTAVAAAVRPLGLVLEPRRKQGEEVKIYLIETRESTEVWPVGWPIEQPLFQVAPKMFEKTKLQINNVSLQTVLDALERRLEIPFLYDHNALARAEIETTTAKVTLNNEKIGYMVALRKMLGQTRPRLIPELRADEMGKPFLWISTQ